MLSTSTHTIRWVKPDIKAEQWEFLSHPAKQAFYQRYSVGWDQLLAASDSGRLVQYPRSSQLMGMPVALSYDSYDDYTRFLAKAKRGYRQSYAKMETALQQNGTLTLPAPIILQFSQEAMLFSGYRRLCLAWNYGMVPYVWLVTVQ